MGKILRSNIGKILLLFLIWRLLTFSIALIALKIIPEFGAKFPYYQETLINTGLPYYIWAFGNFDGVHYLRIAQDGYAYQFTQAFFPLYPILIRIVSFITFGNLLIAALLISNSAFFVGLVLFYKLIQKNFSEKTAFWSVIFLLAFPTSFYFGAVYTEGVFFLMIVLAFYFLEKNKILLASIVGSFASASRLVGIFLAPVLLFYSLQLNRFLRKYSSSESGVTSDESRSFPKLVLDYARTIILVFYPLLIVSVGLIAYMIYLKIEFNNPLYFLTAQSIWGQERSTTGIVLLPQVFWRYFKILKTTSSFAFFNAAFELSSTIFAIALLIFATKIVKKEWLIFSWLAIMTPTLTGTLASMPRYVLLAFPVYIALAHIKSRIIKFSILLIFIILGYVCISLFTRGYWVA